MVFGGKFGTQFGAELSESRPRRHKRGVQSFPGSDAHWPSQSLSARWLARLNVTSRGRASKKSRSARASGNSCDSAVVVYAGTMVSPCEFIEEIQVWSNWNLHYPVEWSVMYRLAKFEGSTRGFNG